MSNFTFIQIDFPSLYENVPEAQTALQKSDDLFHSLLQRAFKGELTAQREHCHEYEK